MACGPIPTEEREKGNPGVLPLPPMVLEIIESQPRLADNPYVFAAGHGKGHFNSFSQRKEALEKKLAFERPWTIHRSETNRTHADEPVR
jgi:hypothetical protein